MTFMRIEITEIILDKTSDVEMWLASVEDEVPNCIQLFFLFSIII